MDRRALQAALVLLATFILGLVAGVGGTLVVENHLRPKGPALTQSAEGPRGGAPAWDEAPALLQSLDLSAEQRQRVRQILKQSRQGLGQQSAPLREELTSEAQRTLRALEEIAGPGSTQTLRRRLGRLGKQRPNALADPQDLSVGLDRWLEAQDLEPVARNRAQAEIGRFRDRYWELYRRQAELAARVRERTRSEVAATLTPEQRRELHQRIRKRHERRPRARRRDP